jgi:hypothetical protein
MSSPFSLSLSPPRRRRARCCMVGHSSTAAPRVVVVPEVRERASVARAAAAPATVPTELLHRHRGPAPPCSRDPRRPFRPCAGGRSARRERWAQGRGADRPRALALPCRNEDASTPPSPAAREGRPELADSAHAHTAAREGRPPPWPLPWPSPRGCRRLRARGEPPFFSRTQREKGRAAQPRGQPAEGGGEWAASARGLGRPTGGWRRGVGGGESKTVL